MLRFLSLVAALSLSSGLLFSAAQGQRQPPAKPLDLNTASVRELEALRPCVTRFALPAKSR
jgi:hypothetical protein